MKINQSLILLLSTCSAMVVAFLINIMLTRSISKEEFGNYSFVLNLFILGQVLFNFGYFYALSQLIALSDDEIYIRKMYGLGVLFLLCFSLLMSLSLYSYITYSSALHAQVIHGVLILLPFSGIFLFNNYCELLLQSSNRIGLLSFYRFFPKFIFGIGIAFFYFGFINLRFNDVFYLYIYSFLLGIFYVVYKTRPILSKVIILFKETIKSSKKFGFNVYLGSLVAVGSSTLTGVLIGVFGADNQEVASYTIALQLTAPLLLIPNVLGTSHFKEFTHSSKIASKLLLYVYILSCCVILFVFCFADLLVKLFFEDIYSDVATLLKILTVGSVLYGLSNFYNKFILSKGEGKIIRNISFAVGTTLLISNFVLIKLYGATGASIAFVISGATYLLIVQYCYTKITRQL